MSKEKIDVCVCTNMAVKLGAVAMRVTATRNIHTNSLKYTLNLGR